MKEMRMGRIAVITTGGTISMVKDPAQGGAVPALDGKGLLAGLPAGLGEMELVEHSKLPSGHFSVDDMWVLRNRVLEFATNPEVAGVVLVMGTDVLEEVAYLLDITIPDETPIAVTGAMRTASMVGWDGGANLQAAIRAAADVQCRGLGTLVVLNDEIHAARHVTKMHSQSVGTFQSPEWGALGRVDGRKVVIVQRVARDTVLCDRLERAVPLIKLVAGMDDDYLRYVVDNGARGVVLEVFGGGRVPPWWMPTIRRAVAGGLIAVVTSRCPSGRLGDTYGFMGAYRDLVDSGVLFAHGLNGPKARIRLMAAFDAAERQGVSVQRFFGEDGV
jgi:L-asparaginase